MLSAMKKLTKIKTMIKFLGVIVNSVEIKLLIRSNTPSVEVVYEYDGGDGDEAEAQEETCEVVGNRVISILTQY